MISKLIIRAFRPSDAEAIKRWGDEGGGNFLLDHGFVGRATETAVAEKDGQLICALPGTLAIVLGPLLRNPQANKLEALVAMTELARALEFWATIHGVSDSYIAISHSRPKFQEIVEKSGYAPCLADCKILRRQLVQEVPRQEEEELVGSAEGEDQ